MNTSSNRWREALKTWRTGVESTWFTGGQPSCGAHQTSLWTTRSKVGFILAGAVVSRMFAHFHLINSLHSLWLMDLESLKQWIWIFPYFYFENIKIFWAFKMPNINHKSIQPNLSEDLVSNGHVHLPQQQHLQPICIELLILFGDYCSVWTWKWPILGWFILGWFTWLSFQHLHLDTCHAAVVPSSWVVEEKC